MATLCGEIYIMQNAPLQLLWNGAFGVTNVMCGVALFDEIRFARFYVDDVVCCAAAFVESVEVLY